MVFGGRSIADFTVDILNVVHLFAPVERFVIASDHGDRGNLAVTL